MVVISVANNKGGVGKTTSSVNLAAELGKKGYNVLVVDLDPQSSLTIYMKFEPTELPRNTYHIMTRKAKTKEVIITTDMQNVDLVPASMDLSAAEIEITALMNREHILREKLTEVEDFYDFVIIDNMPSLGILTINSFMASDYIIVPVEPSFLSYKGLEIISQTITEVKKYNPKLTLMGTVITMYDARTQHSRMIVEKIKENFPFLNVIVKRSIRFSDAAVAGIPIKDYTDDHFNGSLAYKKLAEEVVRIALKK